jgi:hypothetical protein
MVMWSMVMISRTFNTGMPNASFAREKVRYLPAREVWECSFSGAASVSITAHLADGEGFSIKIERSGKGLHEIPRGTENL